MAAKHPKPRKRSKQQQATIDELFGNARASHEIDAALETLKSMREPRRDQAELVNKLTSDFAASIRRKMTELMDDDDEDNLT